MNVKMNLGMLIPVYIFIYSISYADLPSNVEDYSAM